MTGGGLVRHRAPGQSRAVRIFNGTLTGIGELLITAGLVVALFLCWQLWWTGIDAQEKAQVHSAAFEQTQVESPRVEGTRHTEDPPPVTSREWWTYHRAHREEASPHVLG